MVVMTMATTMTTPGTDRTMGETFRRLAATF